MGRKFVIDGNEINQNSDCFVVAEIGANHMGKVDIKKETIRSFLQKQCLICHM